MPGGKHPLQTGEAQVEQPISGCIMKQSGVRIQLHEVGLINQTLHFMTQSHRLKSNKGETQTAFYFRFDAGSKF